MDQYQPVKTTHQKTNNCMRGDWELSPIWFYTNRLESIGFYEVWHFQGLELSIILYRVRKMDLKSIILLKVVFILNKHLIICSLYDFSVNSDNMINPILSMIWLYRDNLDDVVACIRADEIIQRMNKSEKAEMRMRQMDVQGITMWKKEKWRPPPVTMGLVRIGQVMRKSRLRYGMGMWLVREESHWLSENFEFPSCWEESMWETLQNMGRNNHRRQKSI